MRRPVRSTMIALGLLLFAGGMFGACTDDVMTSSGAGGSGGGSGGDCMVSGEVCAEACDPTLGCVECLTDADCDAEAPICVVGECAECGDSADCPSGESCYPESHECGDSCMDNGDCTDDVAQICDTASGACVGCQTNADCTGPDVDGPICSALTKQCVECADSADCDAEAPICTAEGFCEECAIDTQCDSGQVCSDSVCVDGCTQNADCEDEDLPLCDTGAGRCVECLAASDCEDPEVPVCGEGECVVCATDADCSDVELPYCDFGEACVECLDDEHCDPGFSCDAEVCVAAG